MYRVQGNQKIKEPTAKTEQYRFIRDLLKGENKKIGEIHDDYEEALKQILSFNAENKDFKKIPYCNQDIIKSIEKAYKYMMFQQRNYN